MTTTTETPGALTGLSPAEREEIERLNDELHAKRALVKLLEHLPPGLDHREAVERRLAALHAVLGRLLLATVREAA